MDIRPGKYKGPYQRILTVTGQDSEGNWRGTGKSTTGEDVPCVWDQSGQRIDCELPYHSYDLKQRLSD